MEQGKNLLKPSEKVTCEINLKLPSLNEYIDACRSNVYKASKMKRDVENDIGLFISRLPVFKKPIKVHFNWIEKDMRRDLDNIAFAKKFILDALVKKGKIRDDGRKYVVGFTDTFEQGKETKVVITIEEVER